MEKKEKLYLILFLLFLGVSVAATIITYLETILGDSPVYYLTVTISSWLFTFYYSVCFAYEKA